MNLQEDDRLSSVYAYVFICLFFFLKEGETDRAHAFFKSFSAFLQC